MTTFHFQSLTEGAITVAPYDVTEPASNTFAASSIRKIILEGDINLWLLYKGIKAPYVTDGSGDDAAGTLVNGLATQRPAIQAAVKALKEGWGGTGAYSSPLFNGDWPDDMKQRNFVLQLESDQSTISGEPLYKAVEEALSNLFRNNTNTNEAADSSSIATNASVLNWKHNKVHAWTCLQTEDWGTNGALGDGVTSWFTETLADNVFTSLQLEEILETVASHGQRITGEGYLVTFAFVENDEISASINVIDGRTVGTASALPNKHQWQFILRQKTKGDAFTGRDGPAVYTEFGIEGGFGFINMEVADL